MKEQAAQRCLNTSIIENPNEKNFVKPSNILPQDLQIQMENYSYLCPQFLPNLSSSSTTNLSTTHYYNENSTTLMDLNPIIGNYENSGTLEESISSFSNFDERCNNSIGNYDNMQRQWNFHEVHNLQ
jgi:hypothetical protein